MNEEKEIDQLEEEGLEETHELHEVKEPPLPPPPEPAKADPSLNVVVPQMIAQVVFKSAPTGALPEGAEKTEASEKAQQYMNLTVPILQLFEFHTCLIPGDLSPTTRLVIGCVTLVGGIIMLKPPALGKKKKEKREEVEKINDDDFKVG